MAWVHLCRNSECWCEGMSYGEIVVEAVRLSFPLKDAPWIELESKDMAIKKPSGSQVIKPMPNAWADKGDKQDNPNLFEFLTETKYEDGSPRTTGALSIFTQVGVLKACINDRDNKRSAFVEAPSLAELIAYIEMALCDDDTEWKPHQMKNQPPY